NPIPNFRRQKFAIVNPLFSLVVLIKTQSDFHQYSIPPRNFYPRPNTCHRAPERCRQRSQTNHLLFCRGDGNDRRFPAPPNTTQLISQGTLPSAAPSNHNESIRALE